MHLNQTKRK